MVAEKPLGQSEDDAEDGSDGDVEETVHTAVEAPEEDRKGVDCGGSVGDDDSGSGKVGAVRIEVEQRIESYRYSIRGVSGGESVFEGSGTGHGDSMQRRRQRSRKT